MEHFKHLRFPQVFKEENLISQALIFSGKKFWPHLCLKVDGTFHGVSSLKVTNGGVVSFGLNLIQTSKGVNVTSKISI